MQNVFRIYQNLLEIVEFDAYIYKYIVFIRHNSYIPRDINQNLSEAEIGSKSKSIFDVKARTPKKCLIFFTPISIKIAILWYFSPDVNWLQQISKIEFLVYFFGHPKVSQYVIMNFWFGLSNFLTNLVKSETECRNLHNLNLTFSTCLIEIVKVYNFNVTHWKLYEFTEC